MSRRTFSPMRRHAAAARPQPRRALVLLLVVVAVTMASLIGASAALTASAQRSSASVAADLAQARLAALSGLQGVMAELIDQREAMLAGEPPVVSDTWALHIGQDGSRIDIRLVDVSPDFDGPLAPESGRLDINAASAAMLEGLGLDKALADRIIAARRQRPFASPADLLRVQGITEEMLGDANASTLMGSAVLDGGSTVGSDPTASGGLDLDTALGAPPDLASLVTVFASDPNIQGGIAQDSERFRGRLRVNLNQPWSDRLGNALIERFGQDAADGVQRIMEQGTTFTSDADIIKTLRRLNLPPETWGEILDVFCTSDNEFLPARVDLRTAPERVLAALPGISPEQAGDIVAARDQLPPDATQSPAWLVTEGLLKPDDFELAVDHLTTRCMQWRVRVEAGIVRPRSVDSSIGGPIDAGGGGDAPLEPRVVYEAVIDIASQRPRIAYLRDITLLDAARSVAADPTLLDSLALATPEGDPFGEDGDGLDPLDGSADSEPGADSDPLGESLRETGYGDAGFVDPKPDIGTSPAPGRRSDNRGVPESGASNDPRAGRGSDRPIPDSGFSDRRIGRWSTQGGRS